jgi:hypothetical protein
VKHEVDVVMENAGPADEEDEEDDVDRKPGEAARPMLDYRQYYPTVLPMRPPGHELRDTDDRKQQAEASNIESMPVSMLDLLPRVFSTAAL